MPVIGFINSESPGAIREPRAEFRQGLREAGFIEGQNVAVEYRWAEDQTDRLPAMVADLVRRQVAVIVANVSPAAHRGQGSNHDGSNCLPGGERPGQSRASSPTSTGRAAT